MVFKIEFPCSSLIASPCSPCSPCSRTTLSVLWAGSPDVPRYSGVYPRRSHTCPIKAATIAFPNQKGNSWWSVRAHRINIFIRVYMCVWIFTSKLDSSQLIWTLTGPTGYTGTVLSPFRFFRRISFKSSLWSGGYRH